MTPAAKKDLAMSDNLPARLRGLGTDLGKTANKPAFTPSERGKAAGNVAATILEAADALERAEKQQDRWIQAAVKQQKRAKKAEARAKRAERALSDIVDACRNAGRGNEIVAGRVIERVEEIALVALQETPDATE